MNDYEKAVNQGYKVTTYGGNTFFIEDEHGTCYGYYSTERKAKNAMKQIGKCYKG